MYRVDRSELFCYRRALAPTTTLLTISTAAQLPDHARNHTVAFSTFWQILYPGCKGLIVVSIFSLHTFLQGFQAKLPTITDLQESQRKTTDPQCLKTSQDVNLAIRNFMPLLTMPILAFATTHRWRNQEAMELFGNRTFTREGLGRQFQKT